LQKVPIGGRRYLPKGIKTSNEYVLTGRVAKLKKIAPDFKKIEDDMKSKRCAVVRTDSPNYRPVKRRGCMTARGILGGLHH